MTDRVLLAKCASIIVRAFKEVNAEPDIQTLPIVLLLYRAATDAPPEKAPTPEEIDVACACALAAIEICRSESQ